MNTTLNAIKKHEPCKDSWKKLLLSLGKTQADDDPLPLRYILDTLGVQDAIWALRSLEGVDREIRLFSCACAERALPIYEAAYPNDKRPRNAIEVSRKYANGEATEDELKSACAAADAAGWAAAGAAAADAAWAATEDAADAAADAWVAAWYAARAAAVAAAGAEDAEDAEEDAALDAALDAAWAEEFKSQEKSFIKYFS